MEAIVNLRTDIPARPFVKWAGGKSQLLTTFLKFYPEELVNGNVKRYVEPFVGSGAVLFDIMQKYNIEEAYIFDINKDLINSYNAVKYCVDELIYKLKMLEAEYLKSTFEEREKMYYKIRSVYNLTPIEEARPDIEKAALFIFLNRTCYNGLYRVNQQGLFNVPAGRYKKPTICDEDNLYAAHALLQRVKIFEADYRESIKYVKNNTFVYLDPPYRPLNDTSNFTSYNKSDFDDREQIALAEFFERLDERGAKIMLSNSDPKNENPNDEFFDELYRNYYIHRIQAKRMINSNSSRRGSINEILVTNYKALFAFRK